MHIAAALSANRLCCAGDLGQHPFSELDVLRFIDRCGGYVRRVTHDEIADAIG